MIRAGVIGHPIGHSLSPRIYTTWFEEAGIDGVYVVIDAEPAVFSARVAACREAGWAGLNVTIPHKIAALHLADMVSEPAAAIGASNLLRFQDGLVEALNTDHIGFERSLLHAGGVQRTGKAVVLGAGGAAAAILYALRGWDDVILMNRTRSKADAAAERFQNVTTDDWDQRSARLASADLLVNTTSLGMAGQPALGIDLKGLPADALVADIVYKPLETALLKAARARGLRTAHGLSMLIYQAVPSFEVYTGQTPADPARLLTELEGVCA